MIDSYDSHRVPFKHPKNILGVIGAVIAIVVAWLVLVVLLGALVGAFAALVSVFMDYFKLLIVAYWHLR